MDIRLSCGLDTDRRGGTILDICLMCGLDRDDIELRLVHQVISGLDRDNIVLRLAHQVISREEDEIE